MVVGLLCLHVQPWVPSLSFFARRFCSQVALTPEEQEQRALYAAILEYEQDHVSVGLTGWAGDPGSCGSPGVGSSYTLGRVRGIPLWGPTVLSSKVPCPAGLAKALAGQTQEEPGGPVTSDQSGFSPAQVPRSSLLLAC